MDITYYKEPWEHGVIDNFFDNDTLSHVYKVSKKFVHKFGFSKFEDKIVREYFENKFDTKGTDCLLEFSLIKPMSTPFRQNGEPLTIHDEDPKKKLSVAVYLEPKISEGTIIYDSNKKFVKKIEWVRNRALFFKGQQGITWHSFGNPFKTHRLTLNYFML